MDKLTMAHDYLRGIIKASGGHIDIVEMPEAAWKLADAMQAEADEREDKTRPEVLCEVDWSQAPDDATHYASFGDGLSYWHKLEKLECFDIAPSFGITSLFIMERPHGF